jgi:hypothetical protein
LIHNVPAEALLRVGWSQYPTGTFLRHDAAGIFRYLSREKHRPDSAYRTGAETAGRSPEGDEKPSRERTERTGFRLARNTHGD